MGGKAGAGNGPRHRREALRQGVRVEGPLADAKERARQIAAETGKDPRLVEVILSESVRLLRTRPNLMIVEHRLGYVHANAGVDQSNVGPQDGTERVLLLPRDPGGSAQSLRARLEARAGVPLAVISNDSFGRAWRRGTVGVAIGAAGATVVGAVGAGGAVGRTETRAHFTFVNRP